MQRLFLPPRTVVIGLVLGVIGFLGAYWPAVSRFTFCVEDPLFYDMNVHLDFWGMVKKYYTDKGWGWYRPTTFNAIFWLITRFIDWHNLLAFRAIHFTTFLVLLCFIWRVVDYCLERTTDLAPAARARISLLTTMLYGFSPIHFTPLFHRREFDFVHQIFFIGALFTFGRSQDERTVHPWLWVIATIILSALAITSKEVCIVLPFLFFLMAALSHGGSTPSGRFLLSASVILTIGYLIHVTPRFGALSSGPYRTRFNFLAIQENFYCFWDWSFRLFNRSNTYLQGFRTKWTNGTGTVMSLLFFAGFPLALRTKTNRKLLLGGLAATAILLAVPCFCGGFPWHFALPSIALYAVVATAIDLGLGPFFRPSFRWAFTIVFILALAIQAGWGFRRFVQAGVFQTSYIYDREALLHPPIPNEKLKDNSQIVIRNRVNRGIENYGIGKLFRFVYKRPQLRQYRFQDLAPDKLLITLNQPSTYCVDFDDQLLKWVDVTPACLQDAISLAKASSQNFR